jgi:hypothetical protein
VDKGVYRKTVDERAATPETALAKFCELTGIELTIEQVRNPGDHIRHAEGEAELILYYLEFYREAEVEQLRLRREYTFTNQFKENLPAVLEFMRAIPAGMAVDEMFYYAIDDLKPGLKFPNAFSAEDFCSFFCDVLKRMGDFLEIRQPGIHEDLIDPGPTVDHALRDLIARLLTIRKGAAREAVAEDVLFKKTPVFNMKAVPPFFDEHWYDEDKDVTEVLEEMWRQRKAGNVKWPPFLTYQEVGLLLGAAGLMDFRSDKTITYFGKRMKDWVGDQMQEFLKKRFPEPPDK